MKLELSSEEALVSLVEHGSHSFITPEHGAQIARAFGLDNLKPQKETVTNSGKGLHVYGAKKGSVVEGYSGYWLAECIARRLNPTFETDKMGRGFRFQAALASIRQSMSMGTTDAQQG